MCHAIHRTSSDKRLCIAYTCTGQTTKLATGKNKWQSRTACGLNEVKRKLKIGIGISVLLDLMHYSLYKMGYAIKISSLPTWVCLASWLGL